MIRTGNESYTGIATQTTILASEAPKAQAKDPVAQATRWLLALGIVLRIAVFLTASPFNPDAHYEVIQYIAEHHELPISNSLAQSYHPPLYHAAMAVIYSIWPSPTPIHFVSLLLSIANLWLIRRLIDYPGLIPSSRARIAAFALACCLPQFVMYASFVSNDCLTMLIGTLIFLAALRYIDKPSTGRLITLAVSIAAGLLTKGTFLLTGPGIAIVVLLKESRRGWGMAIAVTLSFCMLWGVLGSYKYAENMHYFGRPIVHNLERISEQDRAALAVWRGWPTVFDINVLELVRRPILKVSGPFSYPLLLYGTFWYPYIPDSSFKAETHGYQWVGRIIYIAAIVPTLVFLIGLVSATIQTVQCIARDHADPRKLILTIAAVLLLSNAAVVIGAGLKFNVWWCFQSRLCFQSMLPAMVLLGEGFEIVRKPALIQKIMELTFWVTSIACVLYFVVEIAFALHLLPAGAEVLP